MQPKYIIFLLYFDWYEVQTTDIRQQLYFHSYKIIEQNDHWAPVQYPLTFYSIIYITIFLFYTIAFPSPAPKKSIASAARNKIPILLCSPLSASFRISFRISLSRASTLQSFNFNFLKSRITSSMFFLHGLSAAIRFDLEE